MRVILRLLSERVEFESLRERRVFEGPAPDPWVRKCTGRMTARAPSRPFYFFGIEPSLPRILRA